MEIKYDENNSYVIINYKQYNYKLKEKYALFDLDHTIIKPAKDGYVFYSNNPNDWKYVYPQIKNKLKSLSETHNIIIITNQGGLIKKDELTGKYIAWLKKIELLLKDLDLPLRIFGALKYNNYRKPNIGCIDILNIKLNKNSFYCGDALGRKNISFQDYSDTDLKFALNLNIKIYSPEHVFLNEQNKIGNIIYPDFPLKTILDFKYVVGKKEMIILVGPPASGKSSISKKLIKDFYINNNFNFIDIVNQDELKTPKKCIDKTKNILKKNGSIVIDKTNPKEEDRKIYIDLAKKYKYKVTCININIGNLDWAYSILEHNNYYRAIKNNITPISHIVYHIYYKNYKEPDINEGFDNIIKTTPMMLYNDLDYLKYYF